MKKLSFLILILTFNLTFSQQTEDIIEPDYIKTIILRPNSSNNYAPIIKLGEAFTLSFDDLEANQKDFTYKIEHFNFDWEPSVINDREFIDGYDEDRIRNYEDSFNTLQYYTHYSIQFPNRNTKIKKSGNYKISILNELDEIIFTRRFIVYEPKVDVGVSVHRSRNISTINKQQSVQFIINHPNLLINNPKEEIKTVVMQNNDWNTAITDLKPQFYRGTQLLYKYTDKTNFWAGNEFHNFDSKLVLNSTVNIARVESGPELYHTILYTNEERIDKPYTLYPDINGNFVIRNSNGDEPNIDSDYTWVYFTLESLENIGTKKVYVNGSFNNWKNNSSNQMKYNSKTGLYEAELLLKQGFYNYQYVTIDDNNELRNYEIDGSFYQTENDYSVLVYYRKFGSRYDEVIGFGSGNSEKIQN
ncbi:type IX secretion system plug protein [Urechidicola croceus]|uniref:Type 9 secretion system plug protein N-terminal domain-containing protein n=1 Tax=Urechidicola croceus TaxID=1850246 RepID=A0A1D8P8B7_9FLAO|nr:type IX secretion system plug protein domain-containing protein [Urechidicola croceus]AOW20819.1 hypothetical protein LPB138_09075 [Urechidicola croceus]